MKCEKDSLTNGSVLEPMMVLFNEFMTDGYSAKNLKKSKKTGVFMKIYSKLDGSQKRRRIIR
jgi:hypothetical protein